MLGNIISFILGGMFGTILMSCFAIAGREDDDMERRFKMDDCILYTGKF